MSTASARMRTKRPQHFASVCAWVFVAACGGRTGLDDLGDSMEDGGGPSDATSSGTAGSDAVGGYAVGEGGGHTGGRHAATGGNGAGGFIVSTSGLGTGGRATATSGNASGGRVITTSGNASGGRVITTGGNASGGTVTGGATAATGGQSTGGASAAIGGRSTGGASAAIGGRSTGGAATGGVATGGIPTSTGGHVATTGGAATGGQSPAAGGSGGVVTETGGVATLPAGGSAAATGGQTMVGSAGSGGLASGGTANFCDAIQAVEGTAAVVDFASASTASPYNHAFFDAPWPELQRSVKELANFPNPTAARGCSMTTSDPLLQLVVGGVDPWQYRAYMNQLASQWLTTGPNSAGIYIRFDGPLDPTSFPTPIDSLDTKRSPILLLRVDGQPAVRGRAVPILTRVFERSRYLEPHTLSVLPYPGFPLEPDALYALVIRRNLGDVQGHPLGGPITVELGKHSTRCLGDPTYDGVYDLLEAQFALMRSDIAVMTVFRSGSPTADLGAVISAADRLDPVPFGGLSVDSASVDSSAGYVLVNGSLDTLVHQFGSPPFLPAIRGGLVAGRPALRVLFDPSSEEGRFLVEPPPLAPGATDTRHPRTERVAYRLSLPLGAQNARGDFENVPVVIYGPGTGGSLDTPFADGTASLLARSNIATFCTTPVLHQERAHAENVDPRLLQTLALFDRLTGRQTQRQFVDRVQSGDLFFNPFNLQAAKGNSLQAALDYAFFAHALSRVSVSVRVNGLLQGVNFDPAKVFFMGHSQGAATGPLLAHSGNVAALALSAPTGHLITNLLGKTKPSDPVDSATALSFIVCDDPSEPLDIHHPQLNLLQHWFEPVDAANYAPLLIGEAPSFPKHVLVLTGTDDHFVAPASHDAVTTAAHLQELSPGLRFVVGQQLLDALFGGAGYDTLYPTLTGNLLVSGRALTGAFGQYHAPYCSDDHFVYLCSGEAVTNWLTFFSSALDDSSPIVSGY